MDNCEECHGPGGVGTTEAPNIVGVAAREIASAIQEVPAMNLGSLQALSSEDLHMIADFLNANGNEADSVSIESSDDGDGPSARSSTSGKLTVSGTTTSGNGVTPRTGAFNSLGLTTRNDTLYSPGMLTGTSNSAI